MKKPSLSRRPRGHRGAASAPPTGSKETSGGATFPSVPDWPLLSADPAWETVDFISDLHLRAEDPETFLAWQHYMQHTAAQAVFILGDLFETWVGDDVVAAPPSASSGSDSFERRCARILLRSAAQRKLFFMRGNRDFLIGEAFTGACGVQLLHDPSILDFAGQRWLLSHGDALCLADTDYMQFRALVRAPAWQQAFLDQPLEQRQAAARALRDRSEAHKQAHPVLVDVDTPAAVGWLRAAGAPCLIHGHTHRPADHALGGTLQRIVLSDWDLQARPTRAEVLRMQIGAGDGPAHVRRVSSALA